MRHQWLDDDDDDEPEEDDRRHDGDKDGGLGLPEGDKIGKLYFKSRTVIVGIWRMLTSPPLSRISPSQSVLEIAAATHAS